MTNITRRRIVFVSYNYWPPDFGGELLISIERLHALAERGFDISVLTSGRPGFPSYQLDCKINIYRSPLIGLGRLSRLLRRIVFFLWAVWYLLFTHMDVVHIGDLPGIGPVSSAIVVWLFAFCARMHQALSVIVHSLADDLTSPLKTRGWDGWWRTSQFRAVDKVISVSPALHYAVESYLPCKSELIVIGIPDIFTRQVHDATYQLYHNQAGGNVDDVIFTFTGSIGYRKGFDTLAQAFAGLAANHTGWRLWVIGPHTVAESQNINPQEVTEVTQPLAGLDGQVVYWGRIDDRPGLRRLLSASDVFVFPSRREGLGVAPLEAMATGLPLITSRIPGVTDLANIEGETGFFIEPGDHQGLQHAMLRLGESLDLRQKMGAAARQRIIEAFDWETYINKWENLYTRQQG